MARLSIDELHRELEATDETYVRRKLMIGGYSPAQAKHVKAWVAQRDADRAEVQAARDLAMSKRTAFWTMVGAWGGIGAVVIGVAAMFVSKAG